ncbi:MAG: TonB-dependent receptor [Flavobacteriaceae bacterium]|nr:TonB-dependent receptor [Flavobacteriaceae bacterium]
MIKKVISLLFFQLTVFFAFAQETGGVVGKLLDAELNNEPLAFANILIKGTTTGTTSDFDGLYEIAGLVPGTYTVVYSYLGYETVEIPNVEIVAGKVTNINVPLSASAGVALEEVVVTTVARKDSEVALLLDQRKAVEIKESIGAREMAKFAVSDASAATQKISGVTSSESSGDIFVRGLGDRYLVTTLNGLPVPSDDVEKKNIDLSLFPARFIKSVSIQKTYNVSTSADQSSGSININSRELNESSVISFSLSTGVNSNVAQDGVFENFKVSPNYNDSQFGYLNFTDDLEGQIAGQDWNTVQFDNPIDYSASMSLGKKFFNNKLALLLSGSNSRSHGFKSGVFKQFRSNFIDDTITDANTYETKFVNSALADITWYINEKHKLKSSNFVINKLSENVFEGGRDGLSTIFEESDPDDGLFQFIRDQNTKQTTVYVSQLSGLHRINDKNTIDWAVGYNLLYADEPNRIRNEINFDPNDVQPDFDVQLGFTGGFQQRKSAQLIDDEEFNGRINHSINFSNQESEDSEESRFTLDYGISFRDKTRNFSSEFIGVEIANNSNPIYPTSIDDLGAIFTKENFDNGTLQLNILGENELGENKDIYTGKLSSQAAYHNLNIGDEVWNVNIGTRFQRDEISVNYDIGNLFPRVGVSKQKYDKIYPSINIRRSLNDKSAFRAAFSKTITLPEFKEISPFEYVSPTGQITRGNPDLTASTDVNFDLKYETFPSNDQLFSLAAFYKNISDPINRVRDRGSAGVFSYFNSADRARVLGLEVESRLNLIEKTVMDADDLDVIGGHKLTMVLNATRMWTKQDLKEIYNEEGNLVRSFKYSNFNSVDLQGAADYIVNASFNYTTLGERPFSAALSGNYASDKVFALGVPTDQNTRDYNYDSAILEKGFVLLDGIVSKEFGSGIQLQFVARNLLNPVVKQTQNILQNYREINRARLDGVPIEERIKLPREEKEITVQSYKLGRTISLGLSLNF